MLTVDGKMHPASDKQAVIGTYGSTARHQITVRRSPNPDQNFGTFQQVNREGNSLINEAIIGTGFKDRFSMDFPVNDSQFANFVLDPVLAGYFLLGRSRSTQSSQRLAASGAVRGSHLSRVRAKRCGTDRRSAAAQHRHSPDSGRQQKRLGFIAGDSAGYPNGRRPMDDVFDISAPSRRRHPGEFHEVRDGARRWREYQNRRLQQFLPLRDAGQQWTQQRSHWTGTGRLHRTTRRYLPCATSEPLWPSYWKRRPRFFFEKMRHAMKRIISAVHMMMVATFAASQSITGWASADLHRRRKASRKPAKRSVTSRWNMRGTTFSRRRWFAAHRRLPTPVSTLKPKTQ
jgi:hypothetical protein